VYLEAGDNVVGCEFAHNGGDELENSEACTTMSALNRRGTTSFLTPRWSTPLSDNHLDDAHDDAREVGGQQGLPALHGLQQRVVQSL
jgi:hypothetical protein